MTSLILFLMIVLTLLLMIYLTFILDDIFDPLPLSMVTSMIIRIEKTYTQIQIH